MEEGVATAVRITLSSLIRKWLGGAGFLDHLGEDFRTNGFDVTEDEIWRKVGKVFACLLFG